jgi:type II secretory pathway pseudopilin PulG
MKLQFRLQKKLWMSLIELLVVITIIWILIWVLVPTIWNTQWRTRDITRQTQVQELAAALMSYKLDYWEFPTVTGEFMSEWNPSSNPYRWDISKLNDLKEWWYIKKIPTDPSNMSISIGTDGLDTPQFYYTSQWYYLYISDGKSFIIITPVEDEKNWNCNIPKGDLFDKLKNINNEDDYYQFLNWTSNSEESWPIYMYKYLNEIL